MATVHCIIETDPNTAFAGWVIGFAHFAVTGSTPEEVEAKLRSRVLSMHEAATLVLESQFVRTFSIDLPPAGPVSLTPDRDPLSQTRS
jgi:hypothetical protein